MFLRYIEHVLPSLGEAGVEQVVLADLVSDVDFVRAGRDRGDSPLAARVKGDIRMADVVRQAAIDRERPLRDELVVPFRSGFVRMDPHTSTRIVRQAQRRFRRHNAARRWVEGEVWQALAQSWHDRDVSAGDVRDAVRSLDVTRIALERMWPILTPAQLLHDLFGSKALLRLAGAAHLTEQEYLSLHRERSNDAATARFTDSDVALLDEAREHLGPRPGKGGKTDDADEIRTYGHIVIDEVQDLTPMQLRMVSRRSLNGSITAVGDIAQATGALAPDKWEDVLAHLPARRPSRRHRAERRLPDPGADHGPRQPGDAGRDPGAAGPHGGTRRRRRAADRARQLRRRAAVGSRQANVRKFETPAAPMAPLSSRSRMPGMITESGTTGLGWWI